VWKGGERIPERGENRKRPSFTKKPEQKRSGKKKRAQRGRERAGLQGKKASQRPIITNAQNQGEESLCIS